MAKPKNYKPLVKEELLEYIANMTRRGHSQTYIASELGISQCMVSMHLKELKERFKFCQLEDMKYYIHEKLAQFKDVRDEAWKGYYKSKEDSLTVSTRRTGQPDTFDPEAGEYVKSNDLIEEIRTVEGRIPHSPFLRIILETLSEEKALLGLDAPKKAEVTQTTTISWEPLKERVSMIDPINAEIEAVEQLALPAPAPAPTAAPTIPPHTTNGASNGIH